MQEQYIQRLHTQDSSVIDDLYTDYGAALFGVISRIVKDEEMAKQVLQDSFLKIWKKGVSYDPEKGRLFTWMLNIARNTAIDLTRTRSFKNAKKTYLLDRPIAEDAKVYEPKDFSDLHGYINNLEDKYKTLIKKAYLQQFTQQEIHEETGIPLGTVKTRLRFALKQLRVAML